MTSKTDVVGWVGKRRSPRDKGSSLRNSGLDHEYAALFTYSEV